MQKIESLYNVKANIERMNLFINNFLNYTIKLKINLLYMQFIHTF